MDLKELYGAVGKERRRAALAHSLAQEVATVPPSRLMNIIGDALRWCASALFASLQCSSLARVQFVMSVSETSLGAHYTVSIGDVSRLGLDIAMICRRRHLGTLPQSAAFDLLHGTEHKQRDEVELYPTTLSANIDFGSKSHPECAVFTPDGMSLVTGSVDGFLEVRSILESFITGHEPCLPCNSSRNRKPI